MLGNYNPKELEKKWIEKWASEGTYKFNPKSKKPIYSIDTPPPFTSGNLHMGHVMGSSWMDMLTRYKRMKGFNAYLPQGFDCHGLPTEMKVEKEFKISPHEREKFLKACKEWTASCIKKMKEQFNSIGYSTDWDYEYHTMDDDYIKLVQRSLIEFYDKGLMYREKHPIMWCPRCETALAKAEVGYIDKKGSIYELKLPINNKENITIATTRPEFLPACVAILVNPEDKRYTKLIGKKIKLPIYDREVPIIADKEVDSSFGTGAVYLCTYGDEQDMTWQKRYNLPVYEIIEKNGTMKNAGFINGLKINEAREKMIEKLKSLGVLINEKQIEHRVLSHTERGSCLAGIELIPLTQWFIKVKDSREEIIKNAKKMKWYPENLIIRLLDWTESMDWDWIVSRQRVFGTPIPFWVCNKCKKIIKAELKELPINPSLIKKKCDCGSDAIGESDVCDCWIDSSVTPLKITKYGEDEEFFKKTYPTTMRQQGYEIIRTWLFYTLFRCYKLTGKTPWTETVLNGMVAGTDGRKMSKSFGNIIAPDEPLNKYSADATRQWALTATLGEDYPFSWKELEYAHKFMNKVWNIGKFTQGLNDKKTKTKPELDISDEWIINELNGVINRMNELLEKNTISALKEVRNFVWHDLADYYLEMIKYRIYGENEKSKNAAIETLTNVYKKSILLLAPYTPFITEEVWRELFNPKESIHVQAWPEAEKYNEKLHETGELMKKIISEGRQYKVGKQLSLGSELETVTIESPDDIKELSEVIKGTLKIKNLILKTGKELKVEIK